MIVNVPNADRQVFGADAWLDLAAAGAARDIFFVPWWVDWWALSSWAVVSGTLAGAVSVNGIGVRGAGVSDGHNGAP